MNDLTIHCVQNDIAWLDPAENFRRVDALLADAAPAPGSLVTLPEMFATGFCMDAERTVAAAESTKAYLGRTARRLGCPIVAGLADASPGGPVNTAALFGPDGGQAGAYLKQRLFSFAGEDRPYRPGPGGQSWTIGGWKAAPFVCYDLRFPELQRRAAADGGEVMIVIANWPAARREHWRALLKARAIENLCYVVAVNRCGRDPSNSYSGDSMILGPRGETLAEAGESPAVIGADLSHATLRDYRASFPALDDMTLN